MSLIKDAGIYVFGSFFVQGLSFVTLPIFSTLMTPSDFGLFASYTFWVSFVNAIIGLQVASSVNNAYLDYGKAKIYRYAASVSSAALVSFAIALAAIYVFAEQLSSFFELPASVLAAGIIQSVFVYYFNVHVNILRMEGHSGAYLGLSILNAAMGTLGAIAIILLHILPYPYIARVASSVVAAVLTGGFSAVVIYKKGRCFFDQKAILYALRITLPLVLHTLAGIMLVRINQMVILKLDGSDAAGIYAYASSFGQIISTLFLACNAAFVPWFYKALDKDIDKTYIFKVIASYVRLFSIGTSAFVLLLPVVIKLLSDPSYSEAVNIVPIISLSFLINFYYTIPVNYEFYLKKTGYIASGTVIACVVNLVGCVAMTPVFHGMGAAVSTLIAYAVLFAMHNFIVSRVFKETRYAGPRQFLKPIILVIAALFATYVFMPLDIVLILLAGCLIVWLGLGFRDFAKEFSSDKSELIL